MHPPIVRSLPLSTKRSGTSDSGVITVSRENGASVSVVGALKTPRMGAIADLPVGVNLRTRPEIAEKTAYPWSSGISLPLTGNVTLSNSTSFPLAVHRRGKAVAACNDSTQVGAGM